MLDLQEFKNFLNNGKNRKILIVTLIILISFVIIYLLVVNLNKTKNNSIEYFETIKNNNNIVPPKIPDQDLFDDKAIENIKNANFKEPKNKEEKELTKLEQEVEEKIADISDIQAEAQKQKEKIKKIERTQKPDNMVAYLKKIQKDIEFRGYDLNFKYEMKEYHENDLFNNWYKIEKISPIFIRFKDENYEYNLRFID